MPKPITGLPVWTDPVLIPQDGEPVVQMGPGGIGSERVYQALANRDVHLAYRVSSLEGGAVRGLRQVESEAELRALTGMANAEHIYWAGYGLLRYAITDTSAEVPGYIVMPNSGVGRWRLEAPRLIDTYLRAEIDAKLAGHLNPANLTTATVWATSGLVANNIHPLSGGDVQVHAALGATRLWSTNDIQAAGNLIASGGIIQLAGVNFHMAQGVMNGPGFQAWGGRITAQTLAAFAGGWAGSSVDLGASINDMWRFTVDSASNLHLQKVAGGVYQFTLMGVINNMPWFPQGVRLDYANELHGDARGFVVASYGLWAPYEIHAGAYNGHIAAGDSTNRGGGTINCYGNLTTMWFNGLSAPLVFAKLGLTEADIEDVPGAEEARECLRARPQWEKERAAKEREKAEKVIQEWQEALIKAKEEDEAVAKTVTAQVAGGPSSSSSPDASAPTS